jgi:hypothetical protein
MAKENQDIPKSKKTLDLEKKIAALSDELKQDKENVTKSRKVLLSMALSMGKTATELEAMGFSIDEINGVGPESTPTTPEPVAEPEATTNTIEPKGTTPDIETLKLEILADLDTEAVLKKRIAELEASVGGDSSVEPINDTQGDTNLIAEKIKMTEALNEKYKERRALDPEEKRRLFQPRKLANVDREIDKLTEKLIAIDKQERPQFYYMVGRALKHNKYIREHVAPVDMRKGNLDLRYRWEENIYITKYSASEKETKVRRGEFCREFSTIGFMMILTNRKELERDPTYKSDEQLFESEHAVYKIVGPDGKIIPGCEKIVGHSEAERIYKEEVTTYLEETKNQFKNSTRQ